MESDEFLEMEYEDRYTIQGDYDSEDESYFEDEEDICPDCDNWSEECTCHPDSPSIQDTIGEWPSYGN